MQSISSLDAIHRGATLYHSAFGFALVREVAPDRALLAWERPGPHLPESVTADALRRVYAVCRQDGFFHRALSQRAQLQETLHAEPTRALAWLLDDLDAPQRVRDVMDWLVGRDLFTPKTFVRWWAQISAQLDDGSPVRLDGEWIRRASARDALPIAQLAPASSDIQVMSEDVWDDWHEAMPESEPFTTSESYLPLDEVALANTHPPPTAFVAIGRAVADALLQASRHDTAAHPQTSPIVLRPDGTAYLATGAPASAALAGQPAVSATATALVEAMVGRALPPGIPAARVIPYLRHRLPDLPPSALAPIATAWRADPHDVPSPAAWARQWADIERAESDRAGVRDPATILIGYDSHIGRSKLLYSQVNQDAIRVVCHEHQALAVLADGISLANAGSGDIASLTAVTAVTTAWSRASAECRVDPRLMDRAFSLANHSICERAREAAGGDISGRMPMGTTLVVANIRQHHVHLAWLGDSRAYLVGPWGASLLTADDNVASEGFEAWCEGRAHAWYPDGHALTRYLGHFGVDAMPLAFQPHRATVSLQRGERLLLLSDGVTDYIAADEAALHDTLAARSLAGTPDDAAHRLIALANEAGGGDNASAIVLEWR